MQALDAVVVTERTSTILKRLPGARPRLIHIPHGAGDRARGFERRIRLFDHVIVAGPKDRSRMLSAGIVQPETCSVSGYVKLDAILSSQGAADVPRLFANNRPILLYNPHFSRHLGSWRGFARLLMTAALDHLDMNVIIAPHVRFREQLTRGDRAWLDRIAAEGRVHVDLGSPRCSDMTYAMLADIYVGDVSSQVYEFLHRPRPCVFFNAAKADWRGNPDFAHWNFGQVIDSPSDLLDALSHAFERHVGFRRAQEAGVRRALGSIDRKAAWRAARIIRGIVLGQGTGPAASAPRASGLRPLTLEPAA
ncbi:CDP-glycerol glycerophosphotransferase family protein [Altericroceibacterium xinjiangense]|uniref:CDP-glycerol glycerophosphotransferase family protein n=1 Tax=Altericroceibacterium xinjiangense TaxID=762261 RepID=UPI0013DE9575|nr:CDP-glycerol glycerophosphotransferase family protein [Altericroceibacterium xinjiangense]